MATKRKIEPDVNELKLTIYLKRTKKIGQWLADIRLDELKKDKNVPKANS